MPELILLICYEFPPNDGIGARRWAKLVKGLAHKGHKVYVIAAEGLKGKENSPWTSDVNHPNIDISRLPRNYPRALSEPTSSLVGKLSFRYHAWKMARKTPGTIYDVAANWEVPLMNKAAKIIGQHSIRNIIVSGAPFNLFYYAAKLKERNPELNLILDYRDPWLHSTVYGMKDLEASRRREEIRKQDFVFKNADWVTCPNEILLEEIRGTMKEPVSGYPQFKVLSHFYDEDDFDIEPVTRSVERSKISIVYGGAIYLGLELLFEEFARALDRLQEDDLDAYKKLSFSFFTSDQAKLKPLDRHTPIVSISPPIGKEFFSQTRMADFLAVFLAPYNKDYKTTKFFEYLYQRRPILCFGPKGVVTESIERDGLGFVIENVERDFPRLLKNPAFWRAEFRPKVNIASYSLNSVTETLRSMLV